MLPPKKLTNPWQMFSISFLKLSVLGILVGLAACQAQESSVSPTPSPTTSPEQNTSASPQAQSTTEPTQAEAIDDFEDKNAVNTLGGGWFTYNDKSAGGDSTVSPFQAVEGGANSSSAAAKMTGKVTKTYPYAFVTLATSLKQDGKPVDISRYKGISFWAKGDGGKYRLQLQSPAIKDFNYYSFVFVPTSEWQRYEVPFDEMTQEEWKDKLVRVPLKDSLAGVAYISWTTYPLGETRESAELELDDVQFMK